jgi:hypothetical protein
MLDILIEKFDNWTLDARNKFHNNSVIGTGDSNYIWESDVNGFYIIRDIGAIYVNNSGEIHAFTMTGSVGEWQSHELFYKQTNSNPLCRFDIPISFTEIEHNGYIMFYKIYHRPNKQQGIDYHQHLLDEKVNNSYFLEYIDDASIMKEEFKRFHMNTGLLIPKLGASVIRRRYDAKGYFWADLKYWEANFSEYIETSLKTLNIVVDFLNYNKLANLDKDMLLDQAKEKWNTI